MLDENNAEVKETATVVNEQAQEQQKPVEDASTSKKESQTETKVPEAKLSGNETGDVKAKPEKVVPLKDLVKERQRRRQIEEKLDALERQIRSNEHPNDLKEIMDDLGVDEDTAKKLKKHFAPKNNASDPLANLQESFRKKAEDISADYDDWHDLQQDMAEELRVVYEQDPVRALSQSPETYYLKAKLKKSSVPQKDDSARELAEKINQKNLATTESAKNGTVKPSSGAPKKFTRAWLTSLSNDDFRKYHSEINAELARGGFKE